MSFTNCSHFCTFRWDHPRPDGGLWSAFRGARAATDAPGEPFGWSLGPRRGPELLTLLGAALLGKQKLGRLLVWELGP